jgi:hypothetical protein
MDVEPDPVVFPPNGQAVQFTDNAAGAYEPLAQGLQGASPVDEKVPIGHISAESRRGAERVSTATFAQRH